MKPDMSPYFRPTNKPINTSGNMDNPKNFPPKGILKLSPGIALVMTSRMIAKASKFTAINMFFDSFFKATSFFLLRK